MRIPSSHAVSLVHLTLQVPASQAAGRQVSVPTQSTRQSPPEHAKAPTPEPHARSPAHVVVLEPARRLMFAHVSLPSQTVVQLPPLHTTWSQTPLFSQVVEQEPASHATVLHVSPAEHVTEQAAPEHATVLQDRSPSQTAVQLAARVQSIDGHVSLPLQSKTQPTPGGQTSAVLQLVFAVHEKTHAPASLQAPPASPHSAGSQVRATTAASPPTPPSPGSTLPSGETLGGGKDGVTSSPVSGGPAS